MRNAIRIILRVICVSGAAAVAALGLEDTRLMIETVWLRSGASVRLQSLLDAESFLRWIF